MSIQNSVLQQDSGGDWTNATRRRSDSPTDAEDVLDVRVAADGAVCVHRESSIDNDGTFFDHVGGDKPRLSRSGDDDVGRKGDFLQQLWGRARVADGDGSSIWWIIFLLSNQHRKMVVEMRVQVDTFC